MVDGRPVSLFLRGQGKFNKSCWTPTGSLTLYTRIPESVSKPVDRDPATDSLTIVR